MGAGQPFSDHSSPLYDIVTRIF